MKMSRISQAVAAVLAVAAAGACTRPGTASPTASSSAFPLAAGTYADVVTTAGHHLYALQPDGNSWRYVADAPKPETGHDEDVRALAPDLSRFLLMKLSDHSLWSVNRSDGDRHLIVTPPPGWWICDAGFDPAADRVWYATSKDNRNLVGLYTVAPDGTGPQQLSGLTGVTGCGGLVWSADGSTMVLLRGAITQAHPPASDYHKVKVVIGNAAGRDVVLGLPDIVRVEYVMAVSADGRTVVVSTEPIDPVAHPVGRQVYLADLGSSSATQLMPPSGSAFGFRTIFQSEPSGRLLGTLDTQITGGHVKLVVGVFDQHGQYLATLPNPSTDTTGTLGLWPVVP